MYLLIVRILGNIKMLTSNFNKGTGYNLLIKIPTYVNNIQIE